MSSSAVARLAVGSVFAVGAVTLALHLADEPASSASWASPATAVAYAGAGTGYDVAPPVTLAGAPTGPAPRVATGPKVALESTLRRPGVPDTGPVPVDLDAARGVIKGFERLGPVHVDPVPAGVSLDDPTDTASLYDRAGLALPTPTLAADTAPEQLQAASAVPPGTPSTKGLSQHVEPSCSGTGADGKRVQVLYVRESSTASRYTDVLPLLRNEIANVDDVFAVSARQSGGERRVRWVHAGCVPVVKEVVVPAGSLNGSFGDTITALGNLGYDDSDRKYLAFTEANYLCGVGTMYDDTRVSGNANDGFAASYARVDKGCWSTRDHSVAAHELTHTLGAVLATAPHATTYGHCTDESDLMCYDDGSKMAMRTVCASSQEQLLDCNGDDYFNTAPPAGSFLASSWNTARSSFLDTPAGGTAPGDPLAVTVTPSATSAEPGQTVTATATSAGATGFSWTVSQACTLAGATSSTVAMTCPTGVSGPVVLTATATDGNGGTATASATVTVGAVTGTEPVAGATAWSSPTATSKDPALLSAVLTDQGSGLPMAGVAVELQTRTGTGDDWRTAVTGLVTRSDGRVAVERRRTTAAWYRYAYAGDSAGEHVSSVSGAILVKARATAEADWHARKHLVIGRLMTVDGAPLPGVTVTLERRYAGSSRWVRVARVTSDAAGRLAVKQRPSRTAYFRWSYRGSELLLPARSASVRATRSG